MDSDLGAMLESVLSDPAQMEKIAHMAQSLMGGDIPSNDGDREDKSVTDLGAQPQQKDSRGSIFSLLGKTFGGNHQKSRSTQLLLAMRPYMRPEKQEKLDRAIKIAEIVHVAGFVMKEYGGDFFGGL